MIPRFRAWNKNKRKMYSVDGFRVFDNKVYRSSLANDEFRKNRIETIHFVEDELNDFILMQSTGFKDRNEVEIFEGDVVEYSLPLGYNGKGVVVFDEERGWFNIAGFYAGIYDYPTIAFSEGTDGFKVIGNIYEHKHLLEEG